MTTIEQVVDEHEITSVIMSYCRGIDRGDIELVRSAYHEDAIDRHGSLFTGSGLDFAQVVMDNNSHIRHSGHHFIGNMSFEFDGANDARVETYFVAVNPHDRAEEGYEGYALLGGRYLDWFQRRNGAWKIYRRAVVTDWSRTDLPGAIWRGVSWQVGGFLRGVRGSDDPSYAFFAGTDITAVDDSRPPAEPR